MALAGCGAISAGGPGDPSAASPPSLPAAGAQVSVSADAPMMPVPRSFLGLSTEYWSLPAWSSHMALLERVLALLRVPGGGPLVLRVGGDSADHAFWDPDRAPMPLWAFAIAPRWLGQLRSLALSDGARLILDLNLVTDTPAQAAAWAAAAEQALPHRSIIAFEIGNEPDIYSRADWLAITATRSLQGPRFAGPRLPAAISPARYALDFLTYARALRRIAPSVELAGPALADPVSHARWLPTVLSMTHGALGLVTIHRYPYSGCAARAHSSTYATIRRLLSPAASTGMADALRRDVDVAHDAGLPLRMTELNSVNCGGRPGVSDTFATALWAPDALFALARAGVDGVNIHVRADAVNAPFAITPYGLAPRPLLYGLVLFTRALGPDARLVRLSSRHRRSLDFAAWAVRVGANSLHLLLIDKSRRPARVTLRLPARGPLTVQRMLAPSIRSQTGVTLGGRSLGADAQWHGRAVSETIAARRGSFTVDVLRQSAALVSVSVRPGALGVPTPARAAHERAAHKRAAHDQAAHERAAHERAAHERAATATPSDRSRPRRLALTGSLTAAPTDGGDR